MAATAQQFDFDLNDPRLVGVEASKLDELSRFLSVIQKHGAVLSMVQAATFASCSNSLIRQMCIRGLFTTYEFMGLKVIPLDEVQEYVRRKNEGLLSKGGGGLKAPKFRDLIKVQ